MASKYENTCDFCGKVTRTMTDNHMWDNKEVALNNWQISIHNLWLEEKEGHNFLGSTNELHKDACLECAKRAASIILKDMPNG